VVECPGREAFLPFAGLAVRLQVTARAGRSGHQHDGSAGQGRGQSSAKAPHLWPLDHKGLWFGPIPGNAKCHKTLLPNVCRGSKRMTHNIKFIQYDPGQIDQSSASGPNDDDRDRRSGRVNTANRPHVATSNTVRHRAG
jgi:hypothetical protein